MNVLKVVVGIIIALVIVVAGAAYFLSNNLNELVKTVVEEVGTETLKTTVSLRAVDISLQDGRARLSGLKIANPKGFDQPYIFQMDDIIVDLDIKALLDKTISIREITIDGAQVVAEQKGASSNLQALNKNMAPDGSSPAARKPSDSGQSPADDILIKVGLFQFINSSAQLQTEKWGAQKLAIPAIRLSNIGGTKGLPPEGLAAAIFKPIVKQIKKAMENQLEGILKKEAKQKLREKEDEAKAKLKEKLDKELGGDSDETVNALKSLFSK
jgi:uncharacterized protein involved in outer membrane biogenesis